MNNNNKKTQKTNQRRKTVLKLTKLTIIQVSIFVTELIWT